MTVGDRTKVLIIEDEKTIRNFITAVLNANNYSVLHAASGEQAVAMAASHVPDLVLLDLGLPDMDGIEVLRKLREWFDAPIIVVSARMEERYKVTALDAGANDYITKPFGNSEFLARARAALRQYERVKSGRLSEGSVFVLNGLKLDYARRRVTVDGAHVHLTPIEYSILTLLARNAGKVLTHDYIIREVWGPFACDSQLLRVNMANIRRKIEPNAADPRYILTEVGVGYRIAEA